MMRPGLALMLLSAGLALSSGAHAQTVPGPDSIARHFGNAWSVCFGEEERRAPGIVDAMSLWTDLGSEGRPQFLENVALFRHLDLVGLQNMPETIEGVSQLIGGLSEGIERELQALSEEFEEAETTLMAGPDGWYGAVRTNDNAFYRERTCTFFHESPSDEFVDAIEPVFELFPPVESLIGTYWHIGGPNLNSDAGTRSFGARVFGPNQQLFPGSPMIVVTFQHRRMKPQ